MVNWVNAGLLYEVTAGPRADVVKVIVWPLSPTTVVAQGFCRVTVKVTGVLITGELFNELVKIKVYTLVPSKGMVSKIPKLYGVVLSVKILDIAGPEVYKLVPGKATAFTVTDFAAV